MFRIFVIAMKQVDTEKKQEIVFYGILWGIVFLLVPVIMLFHGLSGGTAFHFPDVLRIWLGILPFFLLFLVHDSLAAPLWVEKGKVGAYAAATLALLLLFGTYVWMTRRIPPEVFGENRPPRDGGMPMAPETMKFLLGLLLLGVNLGVKYYLKSLRTERKMQALKAENLERQLETLRYQINPHFFMNTLNNIHALVDIDPEQAKVSIEEFSKLMRHILYEGDHPTIPLSKELEFLRNYVSLMKMRHTDAVSIEWDLPDDVSGAEIPPLVLASFVENAFKHGVSYEKPSFIRIAVSLEDGKIAFLCANSCPKRDGPRERGVGLANVRGRLDLLYGDRYTLRVDPGDEIYEVFLLLPAEAAGV